jgi:hypothetical protein
MGALSMHGPCIAISSPVEEDDMALLRVAASEVLLLHVAVMRFADAAEVVLITGKKRNNSNPRENRNNNLCNLFWKVFIGKMIFLPICALPLLAGFSILVGIDRRALY